MDYAINVPINPASFGQASISILRELYGRSSEPYLFPIGSVDLSSFREDEGFSDWISQAIERGPMHSRDSPSFKLWHIQGSLESVSRNQFLMTFYECNSPTPAELNIARNNNLILTNKHSQDVFKSKGIESTVIPLAFDDHSFHETNTKYYDDDRIVFNLCGKFERRKNHKKIIRAWAKKFGNNKKYYLQCSLWNQFFTEEDNKNNFISTTEGREYYNIQFLAYMPENSVYNDFLNSSDIVIAMSGGEGWGLPEFTSVCLGKHAVTLNAHGYKEWANEENSTLIEAKGEYEVYDGIFFKRGGIYNQGTFQDFDEDDFISGCEEAIKKHENSKVNPAGLKLKKQFNYKNTVDKILDTLHDM
jgi:glycosyltransferase involved in cell wall biosynthesis